MKYKEWLQEWLKNYVKISAKQRTVSRYTEISNDHLIPSLGEYELQSLSPIILQKYISELLECGNLKTGYGLSSSSVNSIITVIQSSLNVAFNLGLMTEKVGDKLKRPKPIWFDEKVLSSNAYLAVVNNSELDNVAKSFLLSGYLNAAGGQFKEAGILSLKAAWIFDDKNENQNAIRARSKASKYLLNYVNQKEDINAATMVVDINRRIGEFDAAKEAAVQLLGFGVTGLLEKILQYEISLIDAKDSACHTVGEIKGI